jgi:serine/threonine-protein kinase
MAGLQGKQLDHYLMIEQIGQGGMATVLRGEDTRNRDSVAVKVLSPTISGDRRFVRRFRREGGLVSRMRHPNIIPVIDYGEDEGMIYLVMPFVSGETLYQRYRRGGLQLQQAAEWMSEVAEALHYAHEQGVIHRDIKPSNIMIDVDSQAKLMDFGLARVIEGPSTLTGSMLMGTPAYMSPEQARGEKLDARSDQYSLGVILYQLFTGRLPFDGETAMQTALMHLNEPVPSPRKFNGEISSALERVILTSLSKDPAARFPTVRSLNTAFQASLRGDQLEWLQPTVVMETVSESKPELPHRQREPPRLRRFPGAAILLVALLVALGSLLVPQVRSTLGAVLTGAQAQPSAQPAVAPTSLPTVALATTAPTAPPTEIPIFESASCPGLRVFGFESGGNSATWQLDNGYERSLILEDMLDFAAPASNQAVESIALGDSVIFHGPAVEGEFTWVDGTERIIPNGSVVPLTITFAWEAASTGYAMDLVFSGNCGLQGSW